MKDTTQFAPIPGHDIGPDGSASFLGHIWASISALVILTVICCGVYPLVIFGIAQGIFPGKANGSLVKKDGTIARDAKDPAIVGSALLGQSFALPGYFHPRPSAANNAAGSTYSASGGYDPTSSAGTNFGPLNDELVNGATATDPNTKAETLAYDGVRLRTIHYAVDNSIPFKLCNVDADGKRSDAKLTDYQDAQGNLLDTKLVDAFPHSGATAGLIAADFATAIPCDAVTASASGLDPHISPDNAKLQASRVASARNAKIADVQKLIDDNTDSKGLGILGDPGVNVLMLNLALDAKYPLPASAATASSTGPSTAPSTQP